MPTSIRTFIAVEMDPAVRDAIGKVQTALARRSVEARWTAVPNMHLTLKFLGEVRDADVPRVCEVARLAAAEVEPFTVEATGLGTFGPRGRPRIIWCGFAGSTESLVRLHDHLDRGLAPLGVPGEGRRYTPHLTLGRVRSQSGGHVPAGVIEEYADWSAGSQHVDRIVVFSSRLGPGGPRYDPLARCPLAGLPT